MNQSTIACHDGFDLDLFSWWPESRQIIAPVAGMPLYTFGGVADDGRFVRACYWNGAGAMFFTEPPAHSTDKHGWHNFQGMVTKEPVVCVTAEHAIRWLFVQGYDSRLDCKPWTNRNTISLDLCGCVRGYSASDAKWASVRERARLWLENAVNDVKRSVGVAVPK